LLGDCGEERPTPRREFVHHHLAVALGARQPGALQEPDVMGDQALVAADDPGEVADTGRIAGLQGNGDGEAGRIAESLGGGGAVLQFLDARQRCPDVLGLRQIEAEEVAGVGVLGDGSILHTHRRTNVT
jgi:hypothetical protein